MRRTRKYRTFATRVIAIILQQDLERHHPSYKETSGVLKQL